MQPLLVGMLDAVECCCEPVKMVEVSLEEVNSPATVTTGRGTSGELDVVEPMQVAEASLEEGADALGQVVMRTWLSELVVDLGALTPE
jgi:hypothetical protein